MSDPVTNVEIEDVLSSIRRLVSDEARTMERARKARGGEDSEDEQKLVLTPALRVSEIDHDADGGEVAEELRAEVFVPDPEPDSALDEIDEDEVEDAEAVDVAGDTADSESEDVAPTAEEAPQPEQAEADQAPEPHSEHPAEDLSDLSTDEASASLQDKIAQLEALIGQSKEQFEPDVEGQDEYAGDATDGLDWTDVEDETPEEPAEVEDDIAAPDPEEPVQRATDDMSSDPEAAWSDDEAPEPESEPEPEPDDEPTPDQTLAEELRVLSDDEAVLDEDTLREIVTDIVREELQGALGERITRNVRKLVRREIHRALTSQDFD